MRAIREREYERGDQADADHRRDRTEQPIQTPRTQQLIAQAHDAFDPIVVEIRQQSGELNDRAQHTAEIKAHQELAADAVAQEIPNARRAPRTPKIE